MTDPTIAAEFFFERHDLDRGRVQSLLDDALVDSDDGELFLEYCQSELLGWDDGRLKTASFDTTQGFGLRAVAGESTGYAHASELSEAALGRAAAAVAAVRDGHDGSYAADPGGTNRALYGADNPLG